MEKHQTRVHPWKTAAIAAGVVAVVGVGVAIAVGASTGPPPALPPAAEAGAGAPEPDGRLAATPEQAYALSLPVLGGWLEEDFDHAWIVTAATLEAAAAALDHAARDDVQYAHWVDTFTGVLDVADAVAAGDQEGALTAFAPLSAQYPGPYDDVIVDRSLSRMPTEDALAHMAALEAGIAAGDGAAVRRSAGDVAEAFAEVVRAAQLGVADEPHQVLTRLLPAFRALDDLHTAILDGQTQDAAAAAAALRSSFDTFTAWHHSVSG
ncbi:hypothetical protein [Microbacterium sp. zg.Y909]|uniref:hypothetical protein n=1 Tax=Microbacterium sp. zg.Y909 TaxID=2969413 RepID=UPI00214B88EA|nr:hypothetical protein [Microbacterium sp. zg.Y909]MCR2825875.1 hypothetical protein [Microbacterium sp. zg.Y909]